MIGKVLLIGGILLTIWGVVLADHGAINLAAANTAVGVGLIALVLYASERQGGRNGNI